MLLHNRLSDETKNTVARLLLDLHTTDPNTLESVKNGWSEAKQAGKYMLLPPGYYDTFTKQLGDAKSMHAILKKFAN